MKITKHQLRQIVQEAKSIVREQWNAVSTYEEYDEIYPDEVEWHGPVVNVYYPGGDISRTVIEFEDGHTVTQGDPDEPMRFKNW